MIPNEPAEDRAFREEVRNFLDEKFTPEIRAMAAKQAGQFAEPKLIKIWWKVLYDKGWITPAWPVEYGGTGWTPAQHRIYVTECARVGTPILPGLGTKLCGPAIIRYGTPEQKEFFLPRLRSGKHMWCQGYSEPGAGSDLASLQTRAIRDGDDYVVNGSKLWTTLAHQANWIFLLVRTKTEGKPQAGISFLVAPIDSPGISIQHIISMSGEHDVNQVFFDNVRIPVANRIGEENDGWTVAKAVLDEERGAVSQSQRLNLAVAQVEYAAQHEAADDGGLLAEDPSFKAKLAELQIQVLAIEATDARIASGAEMPTPIANSLPNMQKIRATQTRQELNELRVEALGIYGSVDQHVAVGIESNEPVVGPDHALTAVVEHLESRARTIYAGASEIQRNIIAKIALGL